MEEDRFLILNDEEYLIIDEVVDGENKYILVNSMTDERQMAILLEYEENGETMVKSIEQSEYERILQLFGNKFAE